MFLPVGIMAGGPAGFAGDVLANPNGGMTLSNGNLTFETTNGAGYWYARASTARSTGKRYVEMQPNANGYALVLGMFPTAQGFPEDNGAYPGGGGTDGDYYGACAIMYATNSPIYIYRYGSGVDTYGAKPAVNSTGRLQLAIDFDAGKAWFGDDNAWFAGGNPSAGTGETFNFTPNAPHYLVVGGVDDRGTINFGSSPWQYTPPTGFTGWPA